MEVISDKIKFKTKGGTDIIDITTMVDKAVQSGSINSGIVTLFVPGATGAVTTIEYEPGLVLDLKEFVEKIIPEKGAYNHNLSHSDCNGHAHIRASLFGPSLVLPFTNKKLLLGIWQHLIFVDFDNRPREREVILQLMGH